MSELSRQFAQQRLGKGAVVGGWVSSFYLLLPVVLTPFLGIFIDVFGHRISVRLYFIFPIFSFHRVNGRIVFVSGVFFLVSMLLLKFSHSVPTFGTCISWMFPVRANRSEF